MSEELKSCPFCGDEADLVYDTYFEVPYWVKCIRCEAQGEPCMTEAEAIAAWNNRQSPWIPVTPETLPKEKGQIFVRVRKWDGREHFYYYDVFLFDPEFAAKNPELGMYIQMATITHYMPIPEPPASKDETKEE